jgi:hypothetical protein
MEAPADLHKFAYKDAGQCCLWLQPISGVCFMQQLLVKSALREWGDNARAAGEREVNQLHWRDTFVPRKMSELTMEQ